MDDMKNVHALINIPIHFSLLSRLQYGVCLSSKTVIHIHE